MHKILSAEIILSAYMHAHKHTHTGAHTHKHTDYAKLNLHNLKQAAKNRLQTYEDSSMGWKTWLQFWRKKCFEGLKGHFEETFLKTVCFLNHKPLKKKKENVLVLIWIWIYQVLVLPVF